MGSAGAYRLGPQSGRLLVKTTRTGLGAKAGHDLTIEVTCWHGRATVDAATPANSSVAVEVEVDSLEVREGTGGVKPLTNANRAEITKTLKGVLHTAQHPTITFRSRRVEGSAGRRVVHRRRRAYGHGRDPAGHGAGPCDRWPGGWWGDRGPEPMGIRPYAAFFGALKLSDEIKIDFDIALTAHG
jgi:YceI-like domain